jgi:hypothetical protein
MKQHILIDDGSFECEVHCVDTVDDILFAQLAMIEHDITRVEIRNGEPYCEGAYRSGTFLTTDHYICPECDELRDNSDPYEAKCAHCGRCPTCAPSEQLGLDDCCDECGGRSGS